jgi:hypothetical protein
LRAEGGWQIVGGIQGAETFAEGRSIRDLQHLVDTYGGKNWKKRKGFARVLLPTGEMVSAEVHWYEAHGVGKVGLKVKEWL